MEIWFKIKNRTYSRFITKINGFQLTSNRRDTNDTPLTTDNLNPNRSNCFSLNFDTWNRMKFVLKNWRLSKVEKKRKRTIRLSEDLMLFPSSDVELQNRQTSALFQNLWNEKSPIEFDWWNSLWTTRIRIMSDDPSHRNRWRQKSSEQKKFHLKETWIRWIFNLTVKKKAKFQL